MRKALLLLSAVLTLGLFAVPPVNAKPSAEKLLCKLRCGDDDDRKDAIKDLGKLGCPRYVPIIARYLLSDPEDKVRKEAAKALGHIGDPRAVDPLCEALCKDGDKDVRKEAASALGKVGSPDALPVLRKVARCDNSKSVRKKARKAIEQIEKRLSECRCKLRRERMGKEIFEEEAYDDATESDLDDYEDFEIDHRHVTVSRSPRHRTEIEIIPHRLCPPPIIRVPICPIRPYRHLCHPWRHTRRWDCGRSGLILGFHFRF